MKKMIRIAALAATLTFGLSANAQAQDMETYGGIGVGSFSIKSNWLVPALGSSKGRNVGVFGFVGTDINDFFGLELRGGTTNNADVWGLRYKLNWFISYLGKVQFPIGENLSVYGLAGGTTADIHEYITQPPLAPYWWTVTSTSPSFGGGVKLKIDENWHIGAEWMRYWHNNQVDQFEKVTVDGISATMDMRF